MAKNIFLGYIFFVSAVIALHAQSSGYKKNEPSYQLSEIPLGISDMRININQAQEDSEGYLWFATDNGLWLFDGSTSQSFFNGSVKYPIHKEKISSNFYGLVKDNVGNLITAVLEDNLLIIYNPDKRKIIDTIPILTAIPNGQLLFEVDENNALYYTSIDKKSNLYTLHKRGEDNVERPIFEMPKVNGIDDRLVDINIVKNRIFLLTETMLTVLSLEGELIAKIDIKKGWGHWPSTYSDANDYYLINRKTSTLMKWDFNEQTLSAYYKFPNVFMGMYSDFIVSNNNILCFRGEGLFMYNTLNNTYKQIQKKDVSSFAKAENKILLIENGILVKNDGSILLLEPNKIYKLEAKPKEEAFFKETINGITQDTSFRALAEDSEKNIYVTYYTAEIAKKTAGTKNFEICQIPKIPDVNFTSTFSIKTYKDDIIWNNTLLNFKLHTLKPFSKQDFYAHTTQFLKKDSLWFYTWGTNKLQYYNLSEKKIH